MCAEESDGGRTRARRPLQFTIRALMVLTVVVAVACSLLVASPPWVRSLTAALVLSALAPAATVAIVQGRGYVRAFAMGAVFPAGAAFVCFAFEFVDIAEEMARGVASLQSWGRGDPFGSLVLLAFAIGTSVFSGFVAVVVRWLIVHSQREP